VIRVAAAADAGQVARVQQRAWLRAYADIVSTERVLGWDMDERAERWRGRLEASPITSWVFDLQGRIVGFVSAGPADDDGDDDDGGSSHGFLWALYVDPPAQGAGVGTLLLETAEAALAERGFERAGLWILAANEHGRRFYERAGWSLEEGSETEDPTWSVAAVRYAKALR